MRRRSVLGWVVGLMLLSGAFARAGHAEASSDSALLSDLLSRFAAIQSMQAHFSEEKYMPLLAVPLKSEGTLYYAKPRLLARHTEKPQKGSLILRDDKLSFGDAAHQESLSLDAQPAVRVLVDTFVSVLAGDGAALTKLATLKVESLPGGAFRIHVTPKDRGVLRIVQSMSFEGKGPVLSRMELLDANGDRTVTTFTEFKATGKLSSADEQRLFRIGN